MNDEASLIAFEREAHRSGRQRRASLPSSWDSTTELLLKSIAGTSSSKDQEVSANANNSVHGSVTSSGGGDDEIEAAVLMVQDERLLLSRSNSGGSLTASMKASLLAQNADLASVNESVTKHLHNMLQRVRKKIGTRLAEAEPSVQLEAYRTLTTVPPFSYLPNEEIRALVQDLHRLEFQDGQVIVQQGEDEKNPDVYVLAHQRVVMVKLSLEGIFGSQSHGHGATTTEPMVGRSVAKFVGFLDAPAYFGEWGTLFGGPRTSQVIAGGPQVIVYRMNGARFEQLLQHSAFRLKLALGLRSNGIFADIEAFVAMLRRAVSDGASEFDVPAILASYRKMVPAIHANLHSPQLDLEGWTYAIRRLPDTVTSTYTYLLSNHVPMPFMHSHFNLKNVSVPTVARRRQSFALDHGKLLVVMREKFSDVLDFVSLLCCHLHESGKLRSKLVRPSALDVIHKCLWSPERRRQRTSSSAAAGDRMLLYHYCQASAFDIASVQEQKEALGKLPLTHEEQQSLQALWPKDFLYRIWDMISMHENIQIRSDLLHSYGHATDRWAERIRRAVVELLVKDVEPTDNAIADPPGCLCTDEICLRTEITTHIISSNTTSVRNLLSPYLLYRKTEILEWGRIAHPDIMDHEVLSDSDKFCALCDAYMKHHGRKAVEELDKVDANCFKTLRLTEMTGIQVELIDLNALDATYAELNIAPDPFLAPAFPDYDPDAKSWKKPSIKSNKARLLVNIDYAFGQQAQDIISALSLLFGKSIASVGVMGKAGGLQGRRGDIIVADYLVHQEGDEQTLIDNTGIDRVALHSLSNRAVHSGGVLTVLGTLLQDLRLLNFYKKLYGCVSLEMEGSFYARELRRYKKAGLLTDDVNLRFLYYISDTPLSQDQTETLSSDMSLAEVIPPQYAVTRCLLKPVLEQR
jgi:CRP-like cAMP-binding protein